MLAKCCQHGLQSRWHRAFSSAIQFAWLDSTRAAFGWLLLLDLLDRAPGQNGAIVLVNVPRGIFRGVFVLDHQPFVALFALFQFHQNKAAPQFFPVQAELDFSLFQLLQRVDFALQTESSAVPYHHRSSTIITFRNFPLEVAIVQWMIFGHHRQPLVAVALRRSLRHGPRLQRPIDRQPEIVVQPRCPVFLHHESVAVLLAGAYFHLWQFRHWHPRPFPRGGGLARRGGPFCRGRFAGCRGRLLELTGGFRLARRFRSPVKSPLPPVFFQLGHARILSQVVFQIATRPQTCLFGLLGTNSPCAP